MLRLLEFYQWKKFSIIYQEQGNRESIAWEMIAKHLEEQVILRVLLIYSHR